MWVYSMLEETVVKITLLLYPLLPSEKQNNGTFRAWLHGEFQPGLKFRSAHRAEILLRLHAQFQPGRKTQISVRKFTEVRKHNRYECSRSFFSPGWKNGSDYMDFSARVGRVNMTREIPYLLATMYYFVYYINILPTTKSRLNSRFI